MKRCIFAILAVMLLTGSAWAGPDYFRFGGSADFYGDIDVENEIGAIDSDSPLYSISVAPGWKFGNYRTDVELGYSRIEGDMNYSYGNDKIDVLANGVFEADAYYLYGNLFYDYQVKPGWTAFAGVGGGPKLLDPNVTVTTSFCKGGNLATGKCNTFTNTYKEDSGMDLVFGYQAQLGTMYTFPSGKAISTSVMYGNTINDPLIQNGRSGYDLEAISARLDFYFF